MSTLSSAVAVIGAGQMGRGIAQVCAQAGMSVYLSDVDEAAARAGRDAIGAALQKQVGKGRLEASEATAALERITPVAGLATLGEVDLIVEAATENEALKLDLFRRLGEQHGPQVILASNTSSISITRLAAATRHPERVIGMHFMNPVPVMGLVEVIRGERTSDATLEKVRAISAQLGKTVVASNDFPGFIVNRVLMPMINEAVFALMEGVAAAEDIDAAMKLGTNQPMGPLALADLIGLDTCLAIMEVLQGGLGDSKYRPCPLLRRMVAAGKLGRKSGEGFYTYN